MKKLLFIALSAVIMVGCPVLLKLEHYNIESMKILPTIHDGTIVTIDSCQYVVGTVYCGVVYTHHNNCRFCAERRKQELKELVEQLKSK